MKIRAVEPSVLIDAVDSAFRTFLEDEAIGENWVIRSITDLTVGDSNRGTTYLTGEQDLYDWLTDANQQDARTVPDGFPCSARRVHDYRGGRRQEERLCGWHTGQDHH